MTTAAGTKWVARWEDHKAQFRANCARVDAAKANLASAYMNQGVDWDEACDDVDAFVSRSARGLSFDALVDALHIEAARYEDM